MNARLKLVLAVMAGAASAAVATEGLHAQAKLKAYAINELEIVDPNAWKDYLATARATIGAAQGHSLRTTAGRIVQIEGSAPPKRVAITEWDSLDDAVAFYKSKAWTDLAPQRDKAVKSLRRYVVEAER